MWRSPAAFVVKSAASCPVRPCGGGRSNGSLVKSLLFDDRANGGRLRSHRFRVVESFEREFAVAEVDLHDASFGKFALENLRRQRVLHLLLDHALQRPGAVLRVVALAGDLVDRFVGHFQRQAGLLQLLAQPLDLQADDRVDLRAD